MTTKLTLIEKAFFLKKTALFSDVDLDLMLALADKVEVHTFAPGETVFSLNQDAHCLYIVFRGTVHINNEHGVSMCTRTSGNFFGDEALFAYTPREYSAVAAERTVLLSLSRTHLVEIMLEVPQVALQLIRVYASVTPLRRLTK